MKNLETNIKRISQINWINELKEPKSWSKEAKCSKTIWGRQCLRFEGVHVEKNKTSDKALTKKLNLCETGVNIPDKLLIGDTE